VNLLKKVDENNFLNPSYNRLTLAYNL